MAAGGTAAWRCRHGDGRCARYGEHARDGATSGFRGGARQRGSDRPAVPTPGPAPPGAWRTPPGRSKWRIPRPARTNSASIRTLWNAERQPGRPPTAGGPGPHLPVAPKAVSIPRRRLYVRANRSRPDATVPGRYWRTRGRTARPHAPASYCRGKPGAQPAGYA